MGKSYFDSSVVRNRRLMHFREKILLAVLTRTLGLWSRGGFPLRCGRWTLWALGPVFGSPVLLPLSVVFLRHRVNTTKDARTGTKSKIL